MGENTAKNENETDISGNVQRAEATFFKYGDFILSVLRTKVLDENQARDLFQDFFLSLCSSPIPQEVQNVKSFIYKALINDIIDRARAVERYQKLTHIFANIGDETVNNDSPLDALIIKEETEKMMELIKNSVRKGEAEAISLRYDQNLPITEVADKMGIDSRSVSRYISTGLRKVRRFIAFKNGD